jgi:metal-responsive CopG/Arc/MetJ family transcriptional regulator
MLPTSKKRVQITFSKDLLAKAEEQAEKEERSLSNLVTIALKKYLEDKPPK